MNEKQRKMLAQYREAIRLFDEDRHEAAYLHRWAYEADGPWRDDAYNALEQDILVIWRKFTPQSTGHFNQRHLARGYSSLEYRVWINDKEQPPRASVEELLQEFDALIAQYEVAHA